jgi:HD-like signal output (HDOD) protein
MASMIATPVPRETLLHVAKSLPAAPRILAELGHLLLDPSTDMGEVTALLRRDTALTARIIRISNSAFYNTGQPYAALEDALARVGYMEVYRLTGLAAMSQSVDRPLALYGVSGAQVRENSLLTALVAELLAPQVGLDARLAYTAGLLRSLGKIVFDGLTRSGVIRGAYYSGTAAGPVAQWETGIAGMNNCDAAAVVLAEWRFPAETIAGIRDHYLLGIERSPLALLLNVAAGAAERSDHRLPGESSYWLPCPVTIDGGELTADAVDHAMEVALERFDALKGAVS